MKENNSEQKKYYSNLSYTKIGEKVLVGGQRLRVKTTIDKDGKYSKSDKTEIQTAKDNFGNERAGVVVSLNNEAKNIAYYTGVEIPVEETTEAVITASGRAAADLVRVARKGGYINICNATLAVNKTEKATYVNIYVNAANAITLAAWPKKSDGETPATEETVNEAPTDDVDDLLAGI